MSWNHDFQLIANLILTVFFILFLQVCEQTEFIDDASFQPFRASGKSEPYVKRSANTRMLSAEKLMYICKDQLGIEREYEQKLMPDGR